jgi:hypothetical protein
MFNIKGTKLFSMEEQALQNIMDEIKELRLLYQTLVDKLVQVDKATPEEVEALQSDDEYASEEELFKKLG